MKSPVWVQGPGNWSHHLLPLSVHFFFNCSGLNDTGKEAAREAGTRQESRAERGPEEREGPESGGALTLWGTGWLWVQGVCRGGTRTLLLVRLGFHGGRRQGYLSVRREEELGAGGTRFSELSRIK